MHRALVMLLAPVQVDAVVGDRTPALEDIKQLRLTTRVINEAMRLYPQPPVLIRRAIEDDVLGGFHVAAGSDIFISVWNIHRLSGPPSRGSQNSASRSSTVLKEQLCWKAERDTGSLVASFLLYWRGEQACRLADMHLLRRKW